MYTVLATMYFTTVVILISLYAVEILAVDENCVVPNDDTPIENCCEVMAIYGIVLK